jgi:hypothetical protein
MQLQIGKFTVETKDSLTWGDMQDVQAVMAGGAKIGTTGLTGYDTRAMMEAKYRLLEIAVVSIVEREAGNETKLPFTREWMNALSIDDGNTLYDAVDALTKKK